MANVTEAVGDLVVEVQVAVHGQPLDRPGHLTTVWQQLRQPQQARRIILETQIITMFITTIYGPTLGGGGQAGGLGDSCTAAHQTAHGLMKALSPSSMHLKAPCCQANECGQHDFRLTIE